MSGYTEIRMEETPGARRCPVRPELLWHTHDDWYAEELDRLRASLREAVVLLRTWLDAEATNPTRETADWLAALGAERHAGLDVSEIETIVEPDPEPWPGNPEQYESWEGSR